MVQSSGLAERMCSSISKKIELLLGNLIKIPLGQCLRSEEQQKRDHLLVAAKPQHRGWHSSLNQAGYVIIWVGRVLSKWNIGLSTSATSAAEPGGKKRQLTAPINMELTDLLYARAGGMDISLFLHAKRQNLSRGPFPVSVESHPFHFSIYSKFLFFVLTDCTEECSRRRNWERVLFPFYCRNIKVILHV